MLVLRVLKISSYQSKKLPFGATFFILGVHKIIPNLFENVQISLHER